PSREAVLLSEPDGPDHGADAQEEGAPGEQGDQYADRPQSDGHAIHCVAAFRRSYGRPGSRRAGGRPWTVLTSNVRHAGPVPRVEVALTGKFSTRRPGPAGRLDSAGAQAQPGVRCEHVVDRDGRQSWREPVVTTQLIGVCAGPGVG